MMLAAAPPVPPLTREGARAAARHELSKAIYHRNDEPVVLRALRWVLHRFAHALDQAAGAAPGGALGLVGIIALVVLVIVVIRWRIGPVTRSARLGELFETPVGSAVEHRAMAIRHAEAGAWAEAVRERLRAMVRTLEERGVVDGTPGRTADEIAREAREALPHSAELIRSAARTFDEIWYGGRVATSAAYEVVTAADDAVRTEPLSVRA